MSLAIDISEADEVTNATTFTFTGISSPLFNYVRHAIFKDVNVLAVDTVTFIQYDGPLESEMVSHRIGQLPLRFLHTATDRDVVTFEINVVASSSSVKCGVTWVTSQDIVCTSGNAEVVHYRSEKERDIGKKDTGFLLIPLQPDQRVHVTFTARVSNGREGTRWVSCHTTTKVDPFRITIETTGAITPREALKESLSATRDRLRRLSGSLDG